MKRYITKPDFFALSLLAMRPIILIFCLLSSLLTFAQDPQRIRKLDAQCGIYLAKKADTTNGILKAKELTLESFESWLETRPVLDPKEDILYAVGSSYRKELRSNLFTSFRLALDKAGYKDIDLKDIRHLEKWTKKKSGLYLFGPEGHAKKISSLDPEEMRRALANVSANDLSRSRVAILGTPLFSTSKNILKRSVETQLKEFGIDATEVRTKSHMRLKAESTRDWGRSLFFQSNEDYQKWTPDDVRITWQKIIMPSLITLPVLATGGTYPLGVVFSVTFINSANSVLTGYLRKFFSNWYRRAKNYFPESLARDVQLSAFFTADITLVKKISSGLFSQNETLRSALSEIFSWSGFGEIAVKAWPAMAFNMLWRSTVSRAVAKAEGELIEQLGPLQGKKAAAAMMKYTSYTIAPFFVLSLVQDAGLYMALDQGLHFVKSMSELGPEAYKIMSLNYSHGVMAGFGLFGAFMMNSKALRKKVGEGALVVQRFEDKYYKQLVAALAAGSGVYLWHDYKKDKKATDE